MAFAGTDPDDNIEPAAAERPSLRDVLRAGTAASHNALDLRFADLDLTRPEDLRRFLGIHLTARSGVEDWLADNAPPGWEPPRQTELISQDLASLGSETPDPVAPSFDPGSAAEWIGPAYVIAGSHLGNRLLLAQAGRDLPQEARRFLSGTAMQDYWRRLRNLLAGAPGPDGGASALAGAEAAFAHFAACAAPPAVERLAPA